MSWSRISATGALALALLAPTAAAAQSLCPKESDWVTGKPRWWNEAGNPAEWRNRPRLDPGWSGASAASFLSSAGQGGFRAIVANEPAINPSGSTLFVTWQVDQDWFTSDACGNPNARVFFAIADAAAPAVANTRVFRLDIQGREFAAPTEPAVFACDARAVTGDPACANPRPACDLANGVDTPGLQTYAVYATDGAATNPQLVADLNLTKGASYLGAYGALWKDSASTWTVNLAIPLGDATGIPMAGAFKAYFEVRNCTSGEGNNGGTCTIERWPRATTTPGGDCSNGATPYACHPGGQFARIALPPYAEWGTVTPAGTTCTGGISLAYDDIGAVTNPTLTGADPSDPAAYTFDFLTAGLGSTIYGLMSGNPARNVFVARPLNGGSTPIAANQLTARFRIADWGSMADIGTDQGAWNDVPGTGANPVALKAAIAPGQRGALVYSWQLTTTQRCDYGLDPGCTAKKTKDDQCLLVTLRGQGANLDFVNDSVYRNMRFVNASLWADDATLSTEGAPALADGRRPSLFVHVARRQMPYQTDGYVPSVDAYERLQQLAERFAQAPRPGPEMQPLLEASKRARDLLDGPGDRLLGQLERQRELFGILRQLPGEVARQVLPTVDYTVFRETDLRLPDADGTYRVLVPQPGFGVFAQHLGRPGRDGRLNDRVFGWSTALAGNARRLSEGWYQVDFDGKQDRVVLKTQVQALEAPHERRIVDRLVPTGKAPDGRDDGRAKPPCPSCPPGKGVPLWIWIVIGVLGLGVIVLTLRRR